jgi:hypothetical protein
MLKLKARVRSVKNFIKSSLNRGSFANFFMLSFILFTGIGAALISVPIGLIVAGVACGIFGFLLGLE